jgi:hypothetical protein
MHRTTLLLVTFVLAAAVTEALADNDARKCRARNDSVPTSLGATGWAAVDGPVTGGCSAGHTRVFHVRNRSELVRALNKDILLLLDHFRRKWISGRGMSWITAQRSSTSTGRSI